jgi:tRNA dimethylallyltransferase
MARVTGAESLAADQPAVLRHGELPCVLMIAGPTASGKTAVAIHCALALNAEIINADSRQVYRELTIGTAKPTPEERSAVPHHFVGQVSLTDRYTVGHFFQEAVEQISALFARGKNVVVAGGSGLYIKALLDGIFDSPETDESVRKSLQREFENSGLAPLVKELSICDPDLAQSIDTANPHRILRALEVCRVTGKPFSLLRKNLRVLPFTTYVAGLQWDRGTLYGRVDARVDAMLEGGFVSEVMGLLNAGVNPHIQAFNTIGYKEIVRYLSGAISYDTMVAQLKQHTRNFAKRQLTWFRKEHRIHWYEVRDETELDGIHEHIIKDFQRSSHDNR